MIRVSAVALLCLFTSCGPASSGDPDAGGTTPDAGSGPSPSTACSDFPKTVTLGASIDPTQVSAILCLGSGGSTCRVTTNTYSEGDGACPVPESAATISVKNGNNNSLYANQGWTVASSSGGTLVGTNAGVSGIPTGTATTIVLESPAAAGSMQKKLVLTFVDATTITFTSFGAP